MTERRKNSTGKKTGRKTAASKKLTGKEAIENFPCEKASVACTPEQYREIITLMWEGSPDTPLLGKGYIRKNHMAATCLQLEANTGLRIGDCKNLRLCDILCENGRYRFHMREGKTKKLRTFTVPNPVYNMLLRHAKEYDITREEPLFPITVRAIQMSLQKICQYLGYEHISTHSFRKYFATQCYNNSKYDIEVVRRILQHSSSAITLRYIGISDEKIERTLRKTVNIIAVEGQPLKTGQTGGEYATATLGVSRETMDRLMLYCGKLNTTLTDVVEEAINIYLGEPETA